MFSFRDEENEEDFNESNNLIKGSGGEKFHGSSIADF